jgi:hypothetical protein
MHHESGTANKMIGRGYNATNSSVSGGDTGSARLNIPISPLAVPMSMDTVVSTSSTVNRNN